MTLQFFWMLICWRFYTIFRFHTPCVGFLLSTGHIYLHSLWVSSSSANIFQYWLSTGLFLIGSTSVDYIWICDISEISGTKNWPTCSRQFQVNIRFHSWGEGCTRFIFLWDGMHHYRDLSKHFPVTMRLKNKTVQLLPLSHHFRSLPLLLPLTLPILTLQEKLIVSMAAPQPMIRNIFKNKGITYPSTSLTRSIPQHL